MKVFERPRSLATFCNIVMSPYVGTSECQRETAETGFSCNICNIFMSPYVGTLNRFVREITNKHYSVGSFSRNEPAAPSMTFGGDASASESEVRGKCVSAMCLVRFAS